MSKVGGARRGAGRKPGTLNLRSAQLSADILGSGKTPLAYLLEVMMDEAADQKRRDWAAEKAATYIHPRPAPLSRAIQIDIPKMETVADVPTEPRRVCRRLQLLSSTLYKIGRDFELCGAARVNQFAAVCVPCVSGSIGFQPMDEQIS